MKTLPHSSWPFFIAFDMSRLKPGWLNYLASAIGGKQVTTLGIHKAWAPRACIMFVPINWAAKYFRPF